MLVLAALIALPLVEIAGFVVVGERIGALATVTLTALTAAVGLSVARLQGAGVLRRTRAAFAQDEPPVAETLEGVALAVAGLLLLLPGFASDAAGALLLIPPLRFATVYWLLGRLARRRGGGVIDGEFRRVDPGSLPDRRRRRE